MRRRWLSCGFEDRCVEIKDHTGFAVIKAEGTRGFGLAWGKLTDWVEETENGDQASDLL
jgi:hypothetical protein